MIAAAKWLSCHALAAAIMIPIAAAKLPCARLPAMPRLLRVEAELCFTPVDLFLSPSLGRSGRWTPFLEFFLPK